MVLQIVNLNLDLILINISPEQTGPPFKQTPELKGQSVSGSISNSERRMCPQIVMNLAPPSVRSENKHELTCALYII